METRRIDFKKIEAFFWEHFFSEQLRVVSFDYTMPQPEPARPGKSKMCLLEKARSGKERG